MNQGTNIEIMNSIFCATCVACVDCTHVSDLYLGKR